MASVTLSPEPYLTVLDTNGNPVVGAKITTYIAGTVTPQATYTDSTGTVANANPIIADSAGRYVAYLLAGASYKFVITDASSGAIRTQDNISAVPSSSANIDVTGTAGEALTAGQVVYLSDGSGSKVAGQWYKADPANQYSSVFPEVGMVPASIANGASGTIRLGGQVTGLSGLTPGSSYYISTSGAITATAPGNARALGVADSTSSLILKDVPPAGTVDNGIQDFRLTLTTAVPVTTADVTAATSLICTPYRGNRIALFDSTGLATVIKSAEFSIAVPATTSQTYDVFCYDNAGVPTLELLAWTNDTTRATAIVLTTTGVYTKTADLTRRYLGSFRTTTVSGQTEDSIAKRYVWNYYNRVERPMRVIDATGSWAYTTGTLRQARATATNQLDFVVGVSEDVVTAAVIGNASDTTSGAFLVGIGLDSTTTNATGVTAGIASWSVSGAVYSPTASFRTTVAVGRHTLVWLEASVSGTATTWYGADKYLAGTSAGISGTIKG